MARKKKDPVTQGLSEAHTKLREMENRIVVALKANTKEEAQRMLREILFDISTDYTKRS